MTAPAAATWADVFNARPLSRAEALDRLAAFRAVRNPVMREAAATFVLFSYLADADMIRAYTDAMGWGL